MGLGLCVTPSGSRAHRTTGEHSVLSRGTSVEMAVLYNQEDSIHYRGRNGEQLGGHQSEE